MHRISSFCVVLLLLSIAVDRAAAAEEGGFVPIFDGRSLAGWKAADMTYWSVEDGAITATITEKHPCQINQYLVWQGGDLDDFELKLTFRMNSAKNVNGGFQFRSRLLPNDDVAGYQVDNNLGRKWLVRLYDEHGRHTLAWRGQSTVFDAAGKKTISTLPGVPKKARFKLEDWHEYHLVCKGPHLALKVNGNLVAEVLDNDPKQQDFSGILALQLHSGPPMTVQFKDIKLKRLKPAAKRKKRKPQSKPVVVVAPKPKPPVRQVPSTSRGEPISPTGAKFTSPVVTKATPGHAIDIDVDISGAKKLFLAAGDGGDGSSCDWADWIEPRLLGPKGETRLTELSWKSASTGWGHVKINRTIEGTALLAGGIAAHFGIGTHANSVIEYDLPPGYTRFVARGGLDTGALGQKCETGPSIRFMVFLDKPPAAAKPVEDPQPQKPQWTAEERFGVAEFRSGKMLAQPGIVSADYLFTKPPFRLCHASTIVETADRLLVAFYAGPGEGNKETGIWLSARKKGRFDWSPPVQIATGTLTDQQAEKRGRRQFACWNPVLFNVKGGPLLLFYKVGREPEEWWGMMKTSADQGRTWSEAVELPPGIIGPDRAKPVTLHDGVLLCGSATGKTGWNVRFERTPDLGKTWQTSAPPNAADPDFAAIQPTFLVQADGTIQALCRSKSGKILTTMSFDDGKTWTELEAAKLPNPNSGIDSVSLPDGRYLLAYNHTVKGRDFLNLAVSKNGRTWFAASVLEH